jgi:vitamin B12 transporter
MDGVKQYLFTLFFTCLLLSRSFAEELPDEFESYTLEPIVITAARSVQNVSDTPDNVTVITAEEISEMPVHDAAEVVETLTGVGVQSNGGFGRPVTVSIQGSAPRQVRIMVDGIPFNTQSEGTANLSQFPIENIDRIEVVKGGASSVWGSSLGGVINIITKPAGTEKVPSGSITTAVGEWDTYKNSFDLSGAAGDFGYFISGSNTDTQGFRPRSGVLNKSGYGKVSFPFGDLMTLTSSYGYNEGDLDNFEFDPFGVWFGYEYWTRYGKSGLEFKPSDDVNLELGVKYSDQDAKSRMFLLDSEEPLMTGVFNDRIWEGYFASDITLREGHTLTSGIDVGQDSVESTDLVEDKSLDRYAVYSNYKLESGPFDWVLGGRYDDNSEFGSQFSPSLGNVIHISSNTLIRSNISRAFNAPPLIFKFIDFSGTRTPNPDLLPERATVVETGVESQLHPRLWGKLSVYQADITDALQAVLLDDGTYQMQNIAKELRRGVEAETKFEILEKFYLLAGSAYNHIEDRTAGDVIEGGGRPRYTADIGLNYGRIKRTDITLKGHYVWWNEPDDSLANDEDFVWDFKLARELKKTHWGEFSAYLACYNIFNGSNSWHYLYPEPDRYFETGLTCKF